MHTRLVLLGNVFFGLQDSTAPTFCMAVLYVRNERWDGERGIPVVLNVGSVTVHVHASPALDLFLVFVDCCALLGLLLSVLRA